jgi:exodeoxyribonuclease VII large subunit
VELGAQRLDRTGDRLGAAMGAITQRVRGRLERRAASLDALSPLRVLGRGYAVARDADGRLLRRVGDFPAGARFRLTVQDGDVAARVLEAGT